jgi:quinol-cytochrome oxidoreductase complex cytochrome b subunit
MQLGVVEILGNLASLRLPFIGVLGFVNFLLFLYLLHYIFRSMRVVYGEGRSRTAVKFIAITLIYLVLLGVTMLAGLVYSMLQLA